MGFVPSKVEGILAFIIEGGGNGVDNGKGGFGVDKRGGCDGVDNGRRKGPRPPTGPCRRAVFGEGGLVQASGDRNRQRVSLVFSIQ